jgi:hypothetical protein
MRLSTSQDKNADVTGRCDAREIEKPRPRKKKKEKEYTMYSRVGIN